MDSVGLLKIMRRVRAVIAEADRNVQKSKRAVEETQKLIRAGKISWETEPLLPRQKPSEAQLQKRKALESV